jgi:hypothetical protein
MFCAPSSRAFWRAGSGRHCELDAVAARDPFADSGDGLTAVFGCCAYVGHQRLERPEPQVSVRHQLTSSSTPGSTPARTIAAARSAYSALWCWALVWARSSARWRLRMPSNSRGCSRLAPLSSMASAASSSRPHRGRCCSSGAAARGVRRSRRAPDRRRYPTAPPRSPLPGPRPWVPSSSPSATTVLGLGDTQSGA